MTFQGTNQAVESKKQANHQVAFHAPHHGVFGQMKTSFCNDDDSSTINAGSNITHYKKVEGRQSSTASSIKARATNFFHALNGHPANDGSSSHEAAKIDYLLFRK